MFSGVIVYRGEKFLIQVSNLLFNRFNLFLECGKLLSTECCRFFVDEGGLYFEEHDYRTWKLFCENTPKNPEVLILANMILGPKSDSRL